MNCEAFRHQLLIDPLSDEPAFRDHARACPECARAAQDALRFEQSLREALRADLATGKGPAQPRFGRFPARIAPTLLFFSVLLAVFWMGLRGQLAPDSDAPLAATVVAHIQGEEEHLRARGSVTRASLSQLFRTFGADVQEGMGRVRFAGRCVIGEREGIHLVLSGERGAVTALFLPGRQGAEQRMVSGGGLEGTLWPAGFGVLALVGEPGEPLEPVARRLLTAVRWRESEADE